MSTNKQHHHHHPWAPICRVDDRPKDAHAAARSAAAPPPPSPSPTPTATGCAGSRMTCRQQTAPPPSRRSKDVTAHPNRPRTRPGRPCPPSACSGRHRPGKAGSGPHYGTEFFSGSESFLISRDRQTPRQTVRAAWGAACKGGEGVGGGGAADRKRCHVQGRGDQGLRWVFQVASCLDVGVQLRCMFITAGPI